MAARPHWKAGRLARLVLAAALIPGAAGAADFTLELPPLAFPPEILSVEDTGAVGNTDMRVTVLAEGQTQRKLDINADPPTNFCDDTIAINPPLVREGRLWYTNRTTDENLENWQSVPLTEVGTAVDEPDCNHAPVRTTLQGTIPAEVFATNGDEIVYYVQVVDTSGNIATQTPDPEASILPIDPSDYQTQPALAAKPAKESDTTLVDDPVNDTKGSGGEPITAPKVDITGVNVAVGKDHLVLNVKLSGNPQPPDGGVIEGYMATFINGNAVDSDPNDTVLPDGTYVVSTAFQTVLPNHIHALWDAGCLNPGVWTIDELLPCDLSEALVEETDGPGYINWKVTHSSNGMTLFGPNKNASMTFATGQIDINAAPGHPPFWITDTTRGIRYYRTNQVRVVTDVGYVPPPSSCSGVSADLNDAGDTNTCTLTWNDTPGLDGGSYFIFRSTSPTGGDNFDALELINATAPVPQSTSRFDDTGLAKDGTTWHYWCLPRDAEGRIRTPPNGAFDHLCTLPGQCPFADAAFPFPKNAAVSCQTDDLLPPVDPVGETEITNSCGGSEAAVIHWQPGDLTGDLSMLNFGAGFSIERDAGSGFVPVGSKPFVADVTDYSFQDSSPVFGTAHYRIRAVDGAGNASTPGLTITYTNSDYHCMGTLPSNLKVLNQSSQTQAKARLEWDAIPQEDEPDFGTYVVYRCAAGPVGVDPLGNCHDGLIPLVDDPNNPAADPFWTAITCATEDLTQRGGGGLPPSCTDTGIETTRTYWYVVTARDTAGNESPFPTSAYSETGYPHRAAQLTTLCFGLANPPGKVREISATDTGTGGACEVRFKMPTANADGSKFCVDGGTQQYCNGDTDVNPFEIAQYSIIASKGGPPDKFAPPCAITTDVGTWAERDTTFITMNCAGLTNGTTYNIDAFASDAGSCLGPTSGDFTGTPVTCTPTDKVAPAVPTGGKVVASSFETVGIGWKADAPEENGGFNVYVCLQESGQSTCTDFSSQANQAGLVSTPCSTLAANFPTLANLDYCFEDATSFFNASDGTTAVYHYKVTAVDAAGNESDVNAFATQTTDFSVPPATITNCFVTPKAAGDQVDCTWDAYDGSGTELQLMTCKDDHATLDCSKKENWVAQVTGIDKTALTATIDAGVLANGCYLFAVAGKDGNDVSTVTTAPRFPGDGSCMAMTTVPPPCLENCVQLRIDLIQSSKDAGKTVPDVSYDIRDAETGESCLVIPLPGISSDVVFPPPPTNGDAVVPVDPARCGPNIIVVMTHIPPGYTRDNNNEFVCKKTTPLASLLDTPNKTITCELATGKFAGDSNGDNKIDLKDLGTLKAEFGRDPDKADFNGDGKVDLKDLGIIKKYFGLNTD